MNHTEFSSRGGKARAKAMTAKERKRIATAAANKRWKTKRVTRRANAPHEPPPTGDSREPKTL